MQANSTILNEAINRETGDAEVPVSWVAEHRSAFRLVDVREPHELEGPLGKIEGAQNVPLLAVLSNPKQFASDEPLVLICRSGRRSGDAAAALALAGHRAVASVEGGMIAWNAEVLGNKSILVDETIANTDNLADAISRINGLAEVSAAWVAANVGRFRLIDVREPRELAEHGMVAQAENVPLEQFMAAAQALDRSGPLVVMCASGGRSGRVVHALESAGFRAVASLEGGMFGWRASGLSVRQV